MTEKAVADPQKVVPIRKGWQPPERQIARAKNVAAIGMMLRRASVYDAILNDAVKPGGTITFPGFAHRVNVYFQTEIEALEFQRLVNTVCRKRSGRRA